jgi:hypothetical protein
VLLASAKSIPQSWSNISIFLKDDSLRLACYSARA